MGVGMTSPRRATQPIPLKALPRKRRLSVPRPILLRDRGVPLGRWVRIEHGSNTGDLTHRHDDRQRSAGNSRENLTV